MQNFPQNLGMLLFDIVDHIMSGKVNQCVKPVQALCGGEDVVHVRTQVLVDYPLHVRIIDHIKVSLATWPPQIPASCYTYVCHMYNIHVNGVHRFHHNTLCILCRCHIAYQKSSHYKFYQDCRWAMFCECIRTRAFKHNLHTH